MKHLMILGALMLAGCTNIDAVTTDAKTAMAVATEAKMLAEKAIVSADEAKASAAQANVAANDAVEAVSRMAEKCCRK